MNVMILRTTNDNSKVIIGFSDNPNQFIKDWLAERSQFTDIKYSESGNSCEFMPGNRKINSSKLNDGESCYIPLSGNLQGFNDNHP